MKEKIIARIAELEAQKESAVAQVNAIMGAIQDCQFWLAQLDAPESKPKPTLVPRTSEPEPE